MGDVVDLNAERWPRIAFDNGNLQVVVSNKGRVRFKTAGDKPAVLTKHELAVLGRIIASVFRAQDAAADAKDSGDDV